MKTAEYPSGSKNQVHYATMSICKLLLLTSNGSCESEANGVPCNTSCEGVACDSYTSRKRLWSTMTSAFQPLKQHSFPTKHQTVLVVFYLAVCITFCIIPGTAGIDCFKCVSLNGDNPSCEDPFHNNYSVSILESPCMGGRKGRNGLFPATACIKLAGRYSDTGESMVVRTCAVDSGTLTLDTELARMSHCGFFYFDDRYVKGCLQSCDDADGCNGSSRPKHFSTSITALLLITSIGLPAYFLTNLEYRFWCGTRPL